VWASENPHMTGINIGDVTDSGQVSLFFFVQNIPLCYRIERIYIYIYIYIFSVKHKNILLFNLLATSFGH